MFAFVQRKKTLLPMLDARTHASTFVDHRFGESATHLTPEEKALERFTAERQSRLGGASANANKRMRFNLEDDDAADGGEISLTHGGRKLGFGDEDSLEDGGWGGLGVSEGANREPLLNRRKMGAEPEEEEVGCSECSLRRLSPFPACGSHMLIRRTTVARNRTTRSCRRSWPSPSSTRSAYSSDFLRRRLTDHQIPSSFRPSVKS